MNAESENQEPTEPQTSKAAAPAGEPSDVESAASGETPDFRETAERGYGWGV